MHFFRLHSVNFYNSRFTKSMTIYSFLQTTRYCVNPLFFSILFSSHSNCEEKMSKTLYLPWVCNQNVEYVEKSIIFFISVENPVETVENMLFLLKNYNL